jgi:guanine deaminase
MGHSGGRSRAPVSAPERGELLRAPLFHTPRNPFVEQRALECHWDGGLLIREGRVADCGDYQKVAAAHPEAIATDLRGGFLLPGLIDTHVHFPQLRVLGSLGHFLLDWLDHHALPEEARMADEPYALETARQFVQALAAHGTTTALVFGAHFVPPPPRFLKPPMPPVCASSPGWCSPIACYAPICTRRPKPPTALVPS